ncbi:hypothetical protein L9F63_015594 [Diploptera punctata]|uniref:Small ribosomal subunit protein mS31 n=1 Tax=Diploptera punctata TaxID=6984 RepID=A0AAD8A681_DIPPU|nr:hypothetical protein L9F63_015594 [Diploptera punctata]
MLTFRGFSRIQPQLKLSSQFHKLSPILFSNVKDDSSSSDEDEPKSKKNQQAINKLNLLLESMTKENNMVTSTSSIGAQLAKPPVKPKKQKAKTEEPIVEAAKKVAEQLGGDVKQTESELLHKLISPTEMQTKEGEEPKKSINLRELISGMKIDRSKKLDIENEESRAQQVRRILGKRKVDAIREQPSTFRDIIREQQSQKVHATRSRVDLFGGEYLGIFKEAGKDEKTIADVPQLTLWQQLEKRELRLAITHPPKNIYEEMIQWTDQGKLWHFPIDNEQGLEEEKQIDFTEHIFLEHHLDPWCPKKGPLRHFMELVCVGLSKNPHFTVQMKLEHINWFRDYFEDKKQVLLDTGALPTDTENSVQDEKTLS